MTRPTRARGALIALATLLGGLGRAAAADPASWRARVDALSLPLEIVPATGDARAFLVFLSGDGGWAAVDKAVSQGLAARGVTTIGWSSLRYFATRQEPDRVAADLGRVVRALAPPGLPIWLGGYSFGAEVIPVVVAQHWSPAERARLAGMLLLAPGTSAGFRIDPLDWVREPPVDPAYRVDAAVRRLAPTPILCVTGADDPSTSCSTFADVPGVTVARVPGTHHFENGIPRLVDAAVAHLFAKPQGDP